MMAKRSYCYTIRTLYGLAKSEEIGLTDELLHLLVQRETGKTSIRAMTPSEIARVCRVLQKQKDDVSVLFSTMPFIMASRFLAALPWRISTCIPLLASSMAYS